MGPELNKSQLGCLWGYQSSGYLKSNWVSRRVPQGTSPAVRLGASEVPQGIWSWTGASEGLLKVGTVEWGGQPREMLGAGLFCWAFLRQPRAFQREIQSNAPGSSEITESKRAALQLDSRGVSKLIENVTIHDMPSWSKSCRFMVLPTCS